MKYRGLPNTGTSIILILIFVITLYKHIDIEQLFKSYKFWGTLAIIGIFYHSIYVFLLKQPVCPITILPIEMNEHWNTPMLRPRSFFSEPQAFASFIMPFLFISLIKKKFLWSIIITLSVLISTSVQGLFMSLILWGGYLINNNRLKYNLIILISFIILLTFFFTNPVFEFTRNKLFLIDFQTDVRLARGFIIFNSLSGFEKVFGIGFGIENVSDFLQSNYDLEWAINNELAGFTSGFSGTFVQFGILGGILMILMYINIFIKLPKIYKPYLIMIFAASFSQNLLFNAWFLYFILILFGISRIYDNKIV